uniref:Uncharacterized protein n=1 Tax=Aegilops tauschii subsp. strangulata TaxID=200361 RepID=A0A453RRD1_AEGTS
RSRAPSIGSEPVEEPRGSSIRSRERRAHQIRRSRGIPSKEERAVWRLTCADWPISASCSSARADPWNRHRRGLALWIHRSQESRSSKNLFSVVTLKSRPLFDYIFTDIL